MKLTKKLISFILAAVMLVCMSINIFAGINADAAESSDIDAEGAYRFATEFLSDFYNGAHYITKDCDLSKYISNESFLEYMDYVYHGEAFTFSPGWVTDHRISFSLDGSKVIGGSIWLDVVTVLEYKYTNSEGTAHVSNPAELIIGLENGNYVLKDYYQEFWDISLRGGIFSIDDPDFWDDPVKAEALLAAKKKKVEARQRLREEIDARSDGLAKTVPPKEEPEQEKPSPYMIYPLNKNAMVEWAETGCSAVIAGCGVDKKTL